MRLKRPIQTRFRYGSPTRVNLATHHNSQAHSSKGTPSHHTPKKETRELCRLVGTRFQVLFHAPSPGCFSPFPHGTSPLSVTRKYLGLPGGPGRFTRDFSGPVLLGDMLHTRRRTFAYRGLTFYAGPSQNLRLPQRTTCADTAASTRTHPTTPPPQPLPGIPRERFSLIRFRSPLLTESLLFSLPAGTEMFHFPAFPPTALYIQAEVTAHDC